MRRFLFLTLTTFSKTGGIEKFNRSFSKALDEFAEENKIKITAGSVYDTAADTSYINKKNFRGYKGNRGYFILSELWHSRKYDEVILGHINISLLAVLIKFIYPGKKIVIIIHGIEVMEQLSGIKRKALDKCDEIWAVSEFTRQNIIKLQQQPAQKVKIFYNTIDPFFNVPQQFAKPVYLQERYKINAGNKVLLTVTRLNHSENYKGYDKVIEALPEIKKKFPGIRYIIAGKGDEQEIAKLEGLIKSLGVEENVMLTGFVPKNELTDHFLLSDVFIMPSRKEGFGIVFIEALACGVKVIGGNKDGTTDALVNGKLGALINPESVEEITGAVIKVLDEQKEEVPAEKHKAIQQQVMSYFSFEQFKKRLANYLSINN